MNSNYQKPTIKLFRALEELAVMQTGLSGRAPTNAELVCSGIGSIECHSGTTPFFDMNVKWLDNAGSVESGYVVNVKINSATFALKEGVGDCDVKVLDLGAGTSQYEMVCTGISTTGRDACLDDLSIFVQSIVDPDGNSLLVDNNCA